MRRSLVWKAGDAIDEADWWSSVCWDARLGPSMVATEGGSSQEGRSLLWSGQNTVYIFCHLLSLVEWSRWPRTRWDAAVRGGALCCAVLQEERTKFP